MSLHCVVSLLALLVSWVLAPIAAIKLSSYVTPCSLKDPKLDECLLKQATVLLPHLVAGVKEWGVPPLDPLQLPFMQLQNGEGQSAGLSLEITNSSHYGWKDIQIRSLTYNPKTYEFDFRPYIPVYQLQGTYKVGGRILLLPIRGSGFANMTFHKVEAKTIIKCQPEERGGKKYLKVMEAVNTFDVKTIHFQLENLFGNKQLSDAMNDVLNQNPLEALQDIKQPIQDVFSDLYFSIVGRMFSKIPLHKLFTDVD